VSGNARLLLADTQRIFLAGIAQFSILLSMDCAWSDLHVLELPAARRMIAPGHWGWPFRVADFYRNAALADAFSSIEGRVLDFGCGEKPYEGLLRSSKITAWTGVDLEQRTSGSHKPNKADVFWDGKKLPFENLSFDAVLATQVLEHIPDVDPVLEELARVLKPGGSLVITVPMTSVLHEEPHDYRRFTPFGMEREASRHELRLSRAVALGGVFTVLGTLFALHLNPLEKIPVLGRLLHHAAAGLATQMCFSAERFLFAAGFKQHKITVDYLFVLNK
jgi:SAM-dependent methyltransferase